MKKREAVYFFIMLCIITLCACSSKKYGTKENSASVGQTMYFDGMDASKEKNRFKAEITLEELFLTGGVGGLLIIVGIIEY